MAEQREYDSMHWIMGGALVFIAVFVTAAVVIINSQADTVNTSANVNNVAPTVVDVFMTTGADYTQSDNTGGPGGAIDLISGGTKFVKITGTVEDLGGAADISTVSAVFYHSAGTDACSVDNNTCYRVGSCTTQAGSTGEQLDYNCPINLSFYTDSTAAGGPDSTKDWIVHVSVQDTDLATGSNSTLHKEINTLLALSIPGTLNFGTLPVNSQTGVGNNLSMGIEQYGNDEADVEVSMAAGMGCTARGSIPQGNIKWVLTDVAYSDGTNTAVTTTPTDTNLNVGYRTNDGSPLMQTLFWNLSIPSGVEGSCSGNMTITAIPH